MAEGDLLIEWPRPGSRFCRAGTARSYEASETTIKGRASTVRPPLVMARGSPGRVDPAS